MHTNAVCLLKNCKNRPTLELLGQTLLPPAVGGFDPQTPSLIICGQSPQTSNGFRRLGLCPQTPAISFPIENF